MNSKQASERMISEDISHNSDAMKDEKCIDGWIQFLIGMAIRHNRPLSSLTLSEIELEIKNFDNFSKPGN